MVPVKATCMQMCPKDEITMRKSRKLLHQLERDPYQMVKCFSRSAAGCSLNKPHLLRPPSVLMNTISYLLNDVLKIVNVPFNIIYDFIDDRLSAIKQDATIQEVSKQNWMNILPPIIRFYAYAAYMCYEYNINIYDPYLNMKHFHECVLKFIKICLEDSNETTTDELCSEMVSLLIVANLGDYNVLQQGLPFISKKNNLVKKTMLLSVNIMNGNFGDLLKVYNELPAIHQCVISVQLPILRKYILQSMCFGFNCKNNFFPISILTNCLLLNNDKETTEVCKHYGILMIDYKAELSKSLFNIEVDEPRIRKKIQFNVNVSTMILHKQK
ncbi:Domain of unknown function DUF89,SAC3/GANP/THP3 [Cinara cedri]|uniref:SAC3/GANP/THP3 conserved domain-containing protein n=1 Tax=Cinara cedri TaxID=506608 RepID=A0A5E4NQ74_9HEMI|nr:Domain of unknown function DUF89,SAC3/GANP/THP3 [Cinara cedri]